MKSKERFYSTLNVRRAMVAAAPFWLAAASQGLCAATFNATDTASLRTAIDNANASTTSDEVVLASGTYNLSGAALDNANASGDLDVTKAQGDLVIRPATGANVIIDGAALDRVFHINAGANVTVTIQDMTVRNGLATDDGSVTGDGRGGGVLLQQGNLTLNNVTLNGNIARGAVGAPGTPGAVPGGQGGAGNPGGNGLGGGLYVAGGTVQIGASTLSNNSAEGGAGGVGGAGGGPTVAPFIGGNGGVGGAGGAGRGGGVFVGGGTIQISASTFSANDGTGGPGGAGGAGAGGSVAGDGGSGGSGGDGRGGGVYSQGAITISGSTFNGNTTQGGVGGVGEAGIASSTSGAAGDGGVGGAGSGGAVEAAAGADVSASEFTANTAFGGSGGAGGNMLGGGLNQPSGTGGAGGPGDGGALLLDGTINLSVVIVNGNSATGGVGGNAGTVVPSGTFGNPPGAGGQGGPAQGGGVSLGAGVTGAIVQSTISRNSVSGGDGGNGADGASNGGAPCNGGAAGIGGGAIGGGVFQAGGALAVTSSTVSTNDAVGGGGGNAGDGGGFGGGGNNGGAGGDGGDVSGGGIYSDGTLTVQNSTVAANAIVPGTGSAGGAAGLNGAAGAVGSNGSSIGGGIGAVGGTTQMDSSIVADNSASVGADFGGAVAAGASLFETSPSGVLTPGTGANITGQDPQLGALQNNGGATETHDIAAGSPARNAGSNPLNLVEDQRGFTRNDGNGVDMGAHEHAGLPFTTQPTVTDPAVALIVDAATYAIQGAAPADAMVRVYTDDNNNGVVDGADTEVANQQLTGGATNYSVATPLVQDLVNNFLVTAQTVGNAESLPVDVPSIEEDSTPPVAPIVTDPATAINHVGATYDIQGTAEADSLVRVYTDINDNGVVDGADTEVGSQQLTGGATAYSITTPITLSIANNFVVTAEDARMLESAPADVPTITETTPPPINPPVITAPAAQVTVNRANFTITGTAEADSLVRIYRDANNNGQIDPGDNVVGQQQLAGGGTNFGISVPLIQNAANDFVATAEDAAMNESLPSNVPTIIDDNSGGGGTGGSDGSSCETGTRRGPLALLAAMFATGAALLRRKSRAAR